MKQWLAAGTVLYVVAYIGMYVLISAAFDVVPVSSTFNEVLRHPLFLVQPGLERLSAIQFASTFSAAGIVGLAAFANRGPSSLRSVSRGILPAFVSIAFATAGFALLLVDWAGFSLPNIDFLKCSLLAAVSVAGYRAVMMLHDSLRHRFDAPFHRSTTIAVIGFASVLWMMAIAAILSSCWTIAGGAVSYLMIPAAIATLLGYAALEYEWKRNSDRT